MVDAVMVVCPRAELPEAKLLGVQVGGLGLLVRALLTAHHAEIRRLLVVASSAQQPELRHQVAGEPRLDGRVEWVDGVSGALPREGRAVVTLPSIVLQADALRTWVARTDAAACAAIPSGVAAGPWVVPAGLAATCVGAAREGLANWERVGRTLCSQGQAREAVWEGPSPEAVHSAGDVPGVERRMLCIQRSAEDGPVVDRFINRTISERLSRVLVRWPITPNQVSVSSLLTGLLGAWVMAHDGRLASAAGLVLFQLSVVLDHVDGEIARLKFQFSRLGKWLDNVGDHIVDLAVIAGLAWRVAAAGRVWNVASLGLIAVVGVTGSFVVVFWWSLAGPRDPAAPARRGVATLTSMANRDGFYLALWATLLAGHPDWFLWTLAIGSNAYWVAWLALCGVPVRLPNFHR